MPKHQIIRRVKMGGGVTVNKVVNINRQRPAHTELVKTDYNKPVEEAVPAVNPKTKKSVVQSNTEEKQPVNERFSQSKNQPTNEIPINIVAFDESQSKATRAQVLKAINQALVGKPRKLGQRGGFLKRLE